MDAEYPSLSKLFGGYLNQDYTIHGDTLDEVVTRFVEDSSDETARVLHDDVARFLRTHANDLDEEFARRYGYDFAPELWGYTTRSFLEWLVAHANR